MAIISPIQRLPPISALTQDEIRLVEASGQMVIFKVTPDLEESGQAIYTEINEGRMAATLLVYMGSPSRTFNISAKLVSRTVAEATQNFKYKSLLQAWRMPVNNDAGGGIVGDDKGATPRIVRLYGYGDMFMRIPTIVRSVNFTFPSDVDYISDSAGNMLPIVWPVNISLQEAHTMEDVKKFNYSSYKQGTLEEWS